MISNGRNDQTLGIDELPQALTNILIYISAPFCRVFYWCVPTIKCEHTILARIPSGFTLVLEEKVPPPSPHSVRATEHCSWGGGKIEHLFCHPRRELETFRGGKTPALQKG